MSSFKAVQDAVSYRIGHSPTGLELIAKYGLIAVMEEIDNLACGYESIQLEEIGSSDVSCWVHDIEKTLERHHKPVSGTAPVNAASDEKVEYLFRAK